MNNQPLIDESYTPNSNGSADKLVDSVKWRGLEIGRYQVPSNAFVDWISPTYTVDVHLSHPYYLDWKRDGSYQSTWMRPGDICIAQAYEPRSMRWRDDLEIISVDIEPSLIAKTAEDLNLRGNIEIPERHGDSDEQVVHICHALWAESQAGYPMGRIFGESLGTALAACLLQRYGVRRFTIPRDSRLAPQALRRVRDYIEANLERDIGMEDIAKVAGLSPYHFARCFKATIGTTPHQYLITRRIERARSLLTSSHLSLSQIAAQSGFSDQSHLTRHMKRLLGVTPASIVPHQIKRKNVQ